MAHNQIKKNDNSIHISHGDLMLGDSCERVCSPVQPAAPSAGPKTVITEKWDAETDGRGPKTPTMNSSVNQ